MTLQATEQQDIETALARLPELRRNMAKLVRRLEPHVPVGPGARWLDVGAAQGVCVAALRQSGFDAVGVEPWDQAVAASAEVGERTGFELEVVEGTADSIPFPDGSFDVVHAQSVIEHVPDFHAAFREIQRVLRPGGGFYFQTTSALCPRQNEIRGFPLFPWYPRPLKRRIMDWAVEQRPHLVGHTSAPAYHWFTPRMTRRALARAGFSRVLDRWQLKRDEELSGWRLRAFRLLRATPPLKLAGDIAVPDCGYLAIK